MAISSTEQIIIRGNFMDYIVSYTFVGQTTGGGSVSLVSQTFSTLILDITADATIQNYDLVLTDGDGNTFSHTVVSDNIVVYTPQVAGAGVELWSVPAAANNDVVVTDGGFLCENNTGDGWNEHAYFGGAFNAPTKAIIQFDIVELNDASNAYCHIKLNGDNSTARSGSPRIYVSAGTTATIYNNGGGSNADTFAEGDQIKIELTTTTMETFINGNSIQSHTGVYDIANFFVTFIGYRVFKVENIKVITQ